MCSRMRGKVLSHIVSDPDPGILIGSGLQTMFPEFCFLFLNLRSILFCSFLTIFSFYNYSRVMFQISNEKYLFQKCMFGLRLVRFGSKPLGDRTWIRIRIEPESGSALNLDPDPHSTWIRIRIEPGSGSA